MNNGILESTQATPRPQPLQTRLSVNADDLSRAKRELLQAEVRLAKAKGAAAAAEADVKVLSARLKSLAK